MYVRKYVYVRACVRACVRVCVRVMYVTTTTVYTQIEVSDNVYNAFSYYLNLDNGMFLYYFVQQIAIVMILQQVNSMCKYYYVNKNKNKNKNFIDPQNRNSFQVRCNHFRKI